MIRIFRQFRKGRAARRIITFGWPLVLASLSQTLVANIDAAMVGRISIEALAALGVASTVMHFFIIIGSGLSFGLNASVSAELGTRSHKRSARAVLSGLQISVLTGPLVGVLAWVLAPLIYSLMGLKGEVLALALQYSRIFCGFLLFSSTYSVLSAVFAAHTHTRIVMLSSILMASTNICGNYALIFGNWGFPAMGIRGAAIASVVSMMTSTIFLAAVMWIRRIRYHLTLACTETGFRYFAARIARLGMTTVAEWMLWFGGILILNAMVVRCGTPEVALFNVGIKIQTLFMLCMAGTVGANAAMVSRSVGARRPKRIRMWTVTALWVGELSLLPGIVMLLFFPELVLRIYMRAEDILLLENIRLSGIFLALLIMVRVNNSTASTTLRCMSILRYFIVCLFVSEAIMLSTSAVTVGILKWGAAAAFAGNLMEECIRSGLYWRKLDSTLHTDFARTPAPDEIGEGQA